MPDTAAPLTPAPTPTAAAAAAAAAAEARAWYDTARAVYRERDTALLALLCGTVANANVLLLGPPGTAKSAMARAVAGAFGLQFFGVTLSTWTDDASLLGPVDVGALSRGVLSRASTGYLPTAELALLDELPRAGRGVRDLVLPLLAERTLPDGTILPLRAVVSTANTALTEADDQALADRHALVVHVDRVRDPQTRLAVILGAVRPTLPTLPPGTLDTLTEAARAVTVPGPVADVVSRVAETLATGAGLPSAPPYVSERRWQSALAVCRAHAALHGRAALSWEDLRVVLPLALVTVPEVAPLVDLALEAALPAWVGQLAALRDTAARLVGLARRRHLGEETLPDGDAAALLAAETTLRDLARSLRAEHGEEVGDEAREVALAALDDLDAVEDEARARRRGPRV